MHQELKPWVAKAKKKAKKITTYAVILIAIVGIYVGVKHSSKKVSQSQNIDQISMASGFNEEKVTTSNKLSIPDFNNPIGTGVRMDVEVMGWNAQAGFMYSVGGCQTSKGSLMAQNGIDIKIIHQDDCNVSIKDFEANAEQLSNGKTTVPLIVCYMGDGVPGMSSGLNEIKKIKHKAIVFDIFGRSNGEDCFWGPEDWKLHPENCLGKCVAGVAKDGDMNIVLKWCSDNHDKNGNKIRFNPNPKTWDSGALNIINCDNYNVDLTAKVLNNFSEERDVQVSDDKGGAKTLAGVKHTCKVNAWTSWTPVDKIISSKKGGFSRLASTAEYTMQMPCVAIIDANWAEAHPDQIHAFIKAVGMGGYQVRSFPDAQEFAAKVSAKVYNVKDCDANFWLKYYRGCEEEDKNGVKVKLGGSVAFNVSDAAMMLGLGNEVTKVDRYKITYETFGAILTKLYPEDMKGMTPYDEMVDKTYLSWVLAHNDTLKNGKTETMQYASGSTVTEQVSSEAFSDNGKDKNTISFTVGKAQLNSSSYAVLDDIYNSAQISSGLTIFIYGHTDASGSTNSNQTLSEERANAVSTYLQSKGLPANRIQTRGYGDTKAVYGTSADVRNRCVEIIQGK